MFSTGCKYEIKLKFKKKIHGRLLIKVNNYFFNSRYFLIHQSEIQHKLCCNNFFCGFRGNILYSVSHSVVSSTIIQLYNIRVKIILNYRLQMRTT